MNTQLKTDVWRYLKSAMWIAQRIRWVADRSATAERDCNPAVGSEHRHYWEQIQEDVEERSVGDTETPVWEVLHTDL